MKRLKFKKLFDGVGNAIDLIPESYKVDGITFELTDGVETYKVKWEGDLTEGKANILDASGKDMLSENFSKMKHLMNYSSKPTLGILSGEKRIDEDVKFKQASKTTVIAEQNLNVSETTTKEIVSMLSENKSDKEILNQLSNGSPKGEAAIKSEINRLRG